MILICGASGLVGKEICKFLETKNVEYIGTYNKNKINKANMFHIDFSNTVVLEEFFISKNISSCIFCIVERLTDLCENNWNEIKKTNIDLVHTTSYICNKLNIKFIHLSTDYVFDGSVQPNLPNSIKNPLQNYGISKLISEYRVIKNCKEYCIIRTPVLYSSLSKIHDNAVCLIGKNLMDLRNNKTFLEDNYSIRRPLYIEDLCHFIYECIHYNKGVYHFYNPHNKFTKFEICQKISEYLEIKMDNIKPNSTKSEGIAPRPYDTQLQDNALDITQYKFVDFDVSIRECFKKFKHPKINIDNKDKLFIMLDMDGTIIDTNAAHYNAYCQVFKKYGIKWLDIHEWNKIVTNDNIDNYLLSNFDKETVNKLKYEKRKMLVEEQISFTKNSDIFLGYLINNDFNFCVVTNTNKDTIELFMEKLPLLKKIKQWVCRDDYNLLKPNPECYELAKNKYYKNEEYIIGIEDSNVGYNAVKNVTEIIYVYDNEYIFRMNDCYLINDFDQINK